MIEIKYSRIEDKDVYTATFIGDFKRPAIVEFIDIMNGYEEHHPGFGLLFDLTKVTTVSVDFGDLKAVGAHLKDFDCTTGKTSLLIGDDVGRFILAKLFTDLASAFRPNREKAFRKRDEALAWLVQDAEIS